MDEKPCVAEIDLLSSEYHYKIAQWPLGLVRHFLQKYLRVFDRPTVEMS